MCRMPMLSQHTQKMIPKIQSYLAEKPVSKAWLFGSCSRGEDRPSSDVDLLVSFDKDARISLLSYAGMVCDLEDILHRNVDMVEDGMLMPFAADSAEEDKILIYERAN